MTSRWPSILAGTLLWSVLATGASPVARQQADRATMPPDLSNATPLREVDSTRPPEEGTGFLAWIDPVQCDRSGNLYFLQVPHASVGEVQAAATARRELPLIPRSVLRIGTDAKRSTFDPGTGRKFANAKSLATLGIAVGADATLQMLVWATWSEDNDHSEGTTGQFIVSFNKKGEYQTEVPIEWDDTMVRQFETFGTGEFLLVGHRASADEVRIGILSSAGGAPREVPSWSGRPAGLMDRTPRTGSALFDYMVRGGDGRIYYAEQDPRLEETAVYAFDPSGVNGQVLRLPRMPRDFQLSGLRAGGDRVAAIYRQTTPDAKSTHWWIAVFDTVLGGDIQSFYGPTQTEPFCYEREGSTDRFIQVIQGRRVTLAP